MLISLFYQTHQLKYICTSAKFTLSYVEMLNNLNESNDLTRALTGVPSFYFT